LDEAEIAEGGLDAEHAGTGKSIRIFGPQLHRFDSRPR
jgi:hypothetical protein